MEKKLIHIDPPHSILLIKLSAIGDVVHTLPLLEVLRKSFPTARIDWLVEEEAWPIIEGHKDVDHVIISRRKSWCEKFLSSGHRTGVLQEIKRFVQTIRSEYYDLIIDLHGLFKSGILAGLARARRKIGFTGGREGSMLFLTDRPYPFDYNRHALERYLQAAEYLGCRTDSWKGAIPIQETDKAGIDRFLIEHFSPEDIVIAVNPMARWNTKLWDEGRFTSLAARLQDELSCKVLFTGSNDDRPIIDRITATINPRPLNLAGKTTLRELAYLYSRCRLMVSTDTGPMHIAAAMGVPVVALFGPTAPRRTGPYGKNHTVIQENLECSPCFRKRCPHLTCMKSITVEKVFDTVKAHIINQR
ncbi:MAG: lipopolysaccharide heptosyltransferase II [Deltaproteobacteria bacterium]|nr:lipopolysaccharide heptosyltransferase II [Deltaproteobacteria bacterium]